MYYYVPLSNNLLQGLSKVQSLTKLDLGDIENKHMEVIVNSFPSLETLTIESAYCLDPTTAISISSSPPPATKTLRSLTMEMVNPKFATKFIPHFTNLRKLELSAEASSQKLNIRPLSSSLPLLADLHLGNFTLRNTKSLNKFVHLSTLHFRWRRMNDLSFLARKNTIPHLASLSMEFTNVNDFAGLSTSSFASLSHASNLHVLKLTFCNNFNNDCLQYLDNMVHLRKLDLSYSRIVGDSRSLKNLMQNLFQLEELNLGSCWRIGGQGAIAGALYNSHSHLRVLNLSGCDLSDDDLNGIDALKNTLEDLDLSGNYSLTNEALMHCKDLVKLKKLSLHRCHDVSSLTDCSNLEELNVSYCKGLTDDSFKVFSEEPNSFPNLRVLNVQYCETLTGKVFEHLAKNKNLVFQLKELNVEGGMFDVISSSETPRKNLCQLQGLRKLAGFLSNLESESDRNEVKSELTQQLRNLEEII